MPLTINPAQPLREALTMRKRIADSRNLDDVMEFDHPVMVDENGHVFDDLDNVYAPNLYDGELDDASWSLYTKGYSGQSGYNGPIMHDSEYIGGRLAEDILSEPGTYVALVNYITAEDEDSESILEGWAVARLDD